MARLNPAEIEKLRENSGIRLDAEGGFWHEGEPVEHPGVAAAFHRGLGRAPDGRPTLTVGNTWCYIAADDVLFQVRRAVCEDDGERLADCVVSLDDGSEESLVLEPGSIALGRDGVLYVRVKRGEWARCRPDAHRILGRYVGEVNGALAIQTVRGPLVIVARENA